MDLNYDELENSIVESLSEMSIASNAILNSNNQDYLNRAISEVITTYLWSGDFNLLNIVDDEYDVRPVPKPRIRLMSDEDDEKHVKNAWDRENSNNNVFKKEVSSSSFIKVVHEEDLENETPKPSPRKVTNNKLKINQDSQFLKDGSKFDVPRLDFTQIKNNLKPQQQQQQNIKQNQKHDENQQQKINPINKKEKNIEVIINNQNKDDNNNKKLNNNRPREPKPSSNTILPKNIKIDIKSLLKELKLMKNLNIESNEYYEESSEIKMNKNDYTDKVKVMETDLKDLLYRLLEKRRATKRTHDVDKMTREEMTAEKIDTQKELLTFEADNGRPQTKLEKDLMRPLYDHYRKVKRLLSKMNNEGPSALGNDEDYAEEHNVTNIGNNKEHQKILRNLHSLNINELVREKDFTLQEKNKLKDIIKKHEYDFLQINGRVLQKDDREYYKDDFERYKLLKAKLKLIEALLEKNKNRDTQII